MEGNHFSTRILRTPPKPYVHVCLGGPKSITISQFLYIPFFRFYYIHDHYEKLNFFFCMKNNYDFKMVRNQYTIFHD